MTAPHLRTGASTPDPPRRQRLGRVQAHALLLVVILGLAPVSAAAESAPPEPALPPATSETDPVGEWPLRPEPAVERGFDPPDEPWGAGHRGVDLAGRPGQRVHSALPGKVTFAGQLAGRGVVVVGHGATRTTYEPVAASVAVGDRLDAGTPIGALQLSGSHCFPRACLHWGWLEGETYLDPLRLVGGGPVRLLPLWRDAPVVVSALPRSPYAHWRPLHALVRAW
ncbi:M23 family metallopeptidase [Nocardioides ferulae]|uniref:M23 family metallopeptidase n=1 Tax=Nocardioides ferulae TaxID=2340821 RepID=UPI000EB1BA56|nr:peptidoglycan DD-metalloendopeptidase family protein [Nocardioides ferulae]